VQGGCLLASHLGYQQDYDGDDWLLGIQLGMHCPGSGVMIRLWEFLIITIKRGDNEIIFLPQKFKNELLH
jgi:hypothetical protein